MTMISGWDCQELYPGEEWCTRTATRGSVTYDADSNGIDVEERCSGYEGGSGRYHIPANVLMWLIGAVR